MNDFKLRLAKPFRMERAVGLANISANTFLAQQIVECFELDPEASFDPSTWFSYGSNLNSKHFKRKMGEDPRFSTLKLRSVRKGVLPGFIRRLDNPSRKHGLAYVVWKEDISEPPGGILHEVPLSELANYLNMEGVVDLQTKRLWKQPAYKVVEADILTDKKKAVHSLTLSGIEGNETSLESGLRSNPKKLYEYVKVSLDGAKEQKIDSFPFQRDLERVCSTAESMHIEIQDRPGSTARR